MLNPYSTASTWWSYVTSTISQKHTDVVDWERQYQILDAYYHQNGLYEVVNALLSTRNVDDAQLRALRNPAYRVVEFYAAKVWPGPLPQALPIETDNERILEPIAQVWEWSNWQTLKQKAVRTLTKKGDLFIKVASNGTKDADATKVFFQLIQPEYVADFDCDERGYLEWVRLDIPRKRRLDNGKEDFYYHTEIWDKEQLRTWEHKHGAGSEMLSLGDPSEVMTLQEMGIDFIPFVYQPLKGDHEKRAIGSYTLSLDKIDEVNRQVTQLHRMLFRHNKPLWATERTAADPQGRPLPPVRLGASSDFERSAEDEDVVNLPGATSLTSMIPDVNYGAALDVIAAQQLELEKDLPELAYYNLRSSATLSGTAIRLLLGDTIDRALEARAVAESALARADAMALSIGQPIGLWKGIGSYEKGDFAHTFREREVIDIASIDRATTFKAWTDAGAPQPFALREVGATDEEIEQYNEDAQAERGQHNAGLASALLNARTNFDRGE